MDDEDFLAAVEADNANAPVEELQLTEADKAPAAEEPKPEEPVTPAPTLSEPATPTEPPVPTESPKPEPVMVPLAALHETRDEVRDLRAQLAQFQQQHPQQQEEIPDPEIDPVAFANWQAAQVTVQINTAKLDMSEEMARQQHGDEIVDKVQEWAKARVQTKPGFRAEMLRQRNPYGFMVKEYQSEQIASSVTPERYEQFRAWEAAQGQLEQQQAAAAQSGAAPPNQAPNIPPKSLASAPSAGGINTLTAQTDDEIFAETFAKKA